jgi:iron-sulfur cluster repair protein YtfE (RIC family)
MPDQPPTSHFATRSLQALTCPVPSRVTAFLARTTEHNRPGFSFDPRDKRADFVGAYPELDEICERLQFGWDDTVADWSPNPRWVMTELARAAHPPKPTPIVDDLRSASLGEVVDHLLRVHHQPLRWELNRLAILIGALADAHRHQREVQVLASGFALLRDSLLVHLLQEELEAFPLCLTLELQPQALREGTAILDAGPLHFMASGHLETGDDLDLLRQMAGRAELSHDPDAALVANGLSAMHADLQVHTAIENEILLPAALFTCDLLTSQRLPRPTREW